MDDDFHREAKTKQCTDEHDDISELSIDTTVTGDNIVISNEPISTPKTRPQSQTKKRKFDEFEDITGEARSGSKPISPPWKKFAADGPAAFTENGKRRSGRLHHVQLEDQTSSSPSIKDKRSTRVSQQFIKSERDEKFKNRRSLPGTFEKTKQEITDIPIKRPVGRPRLNPVKDETTTERLKDLKPSNRGRPSLKRIDNETLATPQSSSRVDRRSKRLSQVKYPIQDDNATAILPNPPQSPSQDPPTAEHILTPDKRPESTPSTNHTPKLRLKFPKLVLYPRHPDFIPRQTQHSSLESVLEAYDKKEYDLQLNPPPIDPSDIGRTPIIRTEPTLPPDWPEREAKTRLRILSAAEPGGILHPSRSSLFHPDAPPSLPPYYSHVDHLWSHGAYFSILLRRERARHVETAKKLAYACLTRWKERQPMTDEDIQRKIDEEYKLIYNQVVRDVKMKWDLIRAEIDRERLNKWAEEQDLKRDRKMQRLLEGATAMLDRRKSGIDSQELSENDEESDKENDQSSNDEEDEDDVDDGNTSQTDNAEEDDCDEDANMSLSESENDVSNKDKEEQDVDEDEDLSPEALRLKYANIPDLEIEQDPEDDEIDHDIDEEDDDMNQASIEVTKVSDPIIKEHGDDAITNENGNDASKMVLEEVDDILMDDENDESTDMSDDMGTSDDDDQDDDDDSNDEDDDDNIDKVDKELDDDEDEIDGSPGLLGFFGNLNDKTLVTEVDDQSNPCISVKDNNKSIIVKDDNSDHPTPIDDSTNQHTESESTTTIDLDESISNVNTVITTVDSKKITTPIPSLLRGTLREYQHFGLDWLAKLYLNQTNGILADEMGLGKTIQTIALLAHLAEEHHVWGPHLIVVPTSVILNWEMEFKKFLPGFKVLSYYGNQEERQQKRRGWSNPDKYNVVITSYQLILKDLSSIRVPEWHYMILDEAHNIKNFQSQRYQAMIRLKTHARLLLTGTPLQNSIQELWSLLTFLTAGQDGQGMGDLEEFTQWFKRPVDEIFVDGKNKLGVEAQEIVNKLHHSLRPYILRRMKAQVEKQLPAKVEHTIFCRLSKRQRQLYDAFLSRADVKEKLSSGNPISVSQALMALRKVCNHPDLFEERPIITSFTMHKPYSRMSRSVIADYEIKNLLVRRNLMKDEPFDDLNDVILRNFDLQRSECQSKRLSSRIKQLNAAKYLGRWLQHAQHQNNKTQKKIVDDLSLTSWCNSLDYHSVDERLQRWKSYIEMTERRVELTPILGCDLVAKCTILTNDRLQLLRPLLKSDQRNLNFSDMHHLQGMILPTSTRSTNLSAVIQKYSFVTPSVVAHDVFNSFTTSNDQKLLQSIGQNFDIPDPFHESRIRLSIAFPDSRLLQYDCGKLQTLSVLLKDITSRGSRALIFTQMTAMLDILERFLNLYSYKYMRLDGSTRIEQRQDMMERFNRDTRIDVFILSSRSGGVGLNLTGADSVIFFDLDWNPQMDKQCQDRAHRIGQTRDVHIYKLVSEHTIEVNILRKSEQKRMLDEVVIQEGEFSTEWFDRPTTSSTTKTILNQSDEDNGDEEDVAGAAVDRVLGLNSKNNNNVAKILGAAEDNLDVEAAKAQMKEVDSDNVADFGTDDRRASTSQPQPGETENVHVLLDNDGKDAKDEEEYNHVDEYMLRYIRKVMENITFIPPVDKTKKGRLDKNGRDRSHRPRKM